LKNSLKWFEKPLHWGNIMLIIITLLTYLAPLVNPKLSGWLSVLGLMYPIILLFNLAFLAYWLFRRQYTLVIVSTLTILIGWNYLTATFGVNYFGESSIVENQLTIGSYNVRNYRITGKWEKESALNKVKETSKFFQDIMPDITCFQEYGSLNKKGIIKEELTRTFSGKYTATNKYSLYIASKYPIINSESLPLLKDERVNLSSLFADIQINNELIVRVYNIYLASNKVTDETENFEINTKKIQDKSTWKTIYSVFRSIKNNQIIRVDQMKSIIEHIEGSPYPVIVCGDFNDAPLSYTYHLLSKKLTDTFVKKGKGSGTSYNGNIPFLKIDYIFSDYRFNVNNFNIHNEYTGSDHFPISTTLSWK